MYKSLLATCMALACSAALSAQPPVLHLPMLRRAPAIDGDLAEWKELAFSDGVWDIYRLRQTPWFDPSRNRLTDHGGEPSPEEDLQARYYTAWDSQYLYLGAEVRDNINDVDDPEHQDKRWYFKDCICWFLEAPRDRAPEFFGQGDNAFCFVIDARMPGYGAWWRHGSPDSTYLEEPIPQGAVEYRLRFNPWGRSPADFALEARVDLQATFAKSDPRWTPPQVGDVWGLEIVHTDPDGGPYGGHFIVYGTGDDDSTWGEAILTGPTDPVERREK